MIASVQWLLDIFGKKYAAEQSNQILGANIIHYNFEGGTLIHLSAAHMQSNMAYKHTHTHTRRATERGYPLPVSSNCMLYEIVRYRKIDERCATHHWHRPHSCIRASVSMGLTTWSMFCCCCCFCLYLIRNLWLSQSNGTGMVKTMCRCAGVQMYSISDMYDACVSLCHMQTRTNNETEHIFSYWQTNKLQKWWFSNQTNHSKMGQMDSKRTSLVSLNPEYT